MYHPSYHALTCMLCGFDGVLAIIKVSLFNLVNRVLERRYLSKEGCYTL